MLKRDITYEDFNGDPQTESFYFNLSKPELVELEFSFKGGLAAAIQKIIDSKDYGLLISEFKKIILMSYGIKSEDGKSFIKSEELSHKFSQTAAYNALFIELATNENSAADFITGIIPKDMKPANQPLPAPSPPILPS
jgi:hypothetical protein